LEVVKVVVFETDMVPAPLKPLIVSEAPMKADAPLATLSKELSESLPLPVKRNSPWETTVSPV
jgi:hypothetical protein